ncbi:potassium channel family protein [Salinicoccus halodurans]|uniref:Potassium transporter Trk n=1 Tax=Salinicoccus halodurans TaxID=407035 RepID=A0A0F7HJQ5_9STAP|nr:TrkA family potassium uptake protein [Salinicoccus halodurans]AKG73647.1 potassium transporter Trk [Salinicoccus halodurans]SFK53806.1 trk system potassium uptake protein TrkA [Salinicoccus halodurans]
MNKEFAVIGLGRFGGSIVKELREMETDVLAIDIDEERVNEFADIATQSVIGNTTDETVLKNLGLRNFDNVIVAIGDNIQSSILTTLLLKDLGVKKVTVKAQSDYHARVLDKIGADVVVHPERDMGRRIAHRLVSSSVLDYLELSDEHSIVEIYATEKLAEQTLLDLDIRAEYGVSVIAIKRGSDIIVSPDPTVNIKETDVLIVIGTDDDLNKFEKLLNKE